MDAGGAPAGWLVAKPSGRGLGGGLERCSCLYRFINFEDWVLSGLAPVAHVAGAVGSRASTGWPTTRRWRAMRNDEPGRPAWWAASAVPYRYFWLLPSAGVVIGLAVASAFGVPVWLGFICAEAPALAMEAWWRRKRSPSGDSS
jgi:hypothetical protein